MVKGDRLGTLIRMLDPEDYRYIGTQDSGIEARFRRRRMKIYRRALRGIASDALGSYQAQLSNINAAGAWRRYPRLVGRTASSFVAIGKLWMAGTLFRFRLPVPVDLTAQRDRLEKFLALEAPSA